MTISQSINIRLKMTRSIVLLLLSDWTKICLKNMMQLNLTEANIDEFGRFDKLKQSVNKAAAKAFLEKSRVK